MNETDKKTKFEEIGREAALQKLFVGTGYVNAESFKCPADGECVHRVMLEGVDFDLVYTPLKHLGYKVALSAIGSLYARLCSPETLSVVLGISAKLFFWDVSELWQGCVACAKEHSVKSLHLDLVPSMTGLCISLTAYGRHEVEKTASKSMDLVCVSGNLGAAYMGLHVLEREKAAFTGVETEQPDLSRYKYIVGEYLTPQLRGDVLSRMKEFGITPGGGWFLVQSLADVTCSIVDRTGLGVKIYVTRMPIAEQTFDMSEEINIDVVTAALNGGEDYRLLFTIPIAQHDLFAREFPDFDIIGHLASPEVGRVLVTPEGAELTIH